MQSYPFHLGKSRLPQYLAQVFLLIVIVGGNCHVCQLLEMHLLLVRLLVLLIQSGLDLNIVSLASRVHVELCILGIHVATRVVAH